MSDSSLPYLLLRAPACPLNVLPIHARSPFQTELPNFPISWSLLPKITRTTETASTRTPSKNTNTPPASKNSCLLHRARHWKTSSSQWEGLPFVAAVGASGQNVTACEVRRRSTPYRNNQSSEQLSSNIEETKSMWRRTSTCMWWAWN